MKHQRNNISSILEMFVFVGLLQLEFMTYDRIEAPEPRIIEENSISI